eukprot:1365534-Alexandrium_andersonii.AAC.1
MGRRRLQSLLLRSLLLRPRAHPPPIEELYGLRPCTGGGPRATALKQRPPVGAVPCRASESLEGHKARRCVRSQRGGRQSN